MGTNYPLAAEIALMLVRSICQSWRTSNPRMNGGSPTPYSVRPERGARRGYPEHLRHECPMPREIRDEAADPERADVPGARSAHRVEKELEAEGTQPGPCSSAGREDRLHLS